MLQEHDLIQVRVDRTLSHLHLIATHLSSGLVALGPGAEEAEAAVQSFTTTMREVLSPQNGAQDPHAHLQLHRNTRDKLAAAAASDHRPLPETPGGVGGDTASGANGSADVAMMDEDDDNEEVIQGYHILCGDREHLVAVLWCT